MSFILVLVLTLTSTTTAAGAPGFITSQPAMLAAVASGGSVLPIISVGDMLANGYRFDTLLMVSPLHPMAMGQLIYS